MLSVSSINQRPVVNRQQNPNVNLNSQPIYKSQNKASKQNVAFGMEFTQSTQQMIQAYLKDEKIGNSLKTTLIGDVGQLKEVAPDYTCHISRIWTSYWNDFAHNVYCQVQKKGDSSWQTLSKKYHDYDPTYVQSIIDGLADLISIEHTIPGRPGGIARAAENVKKANAEEIRLAKVAADSKAKAKAALDETVDNLFA